jgi:catechol 2,3-dioxygenase-like lactoylglutathione lyase family enzyme
VALGLESFNADQVMTALAAHGITKADGTGELARKTARVRRRGPAMGGAANGTPEVVFVDEDGIQVLLEDARSAGGAGTAGDVVKIEPSPSQGVLAVSGISHFTVASTDSPRSNTFYKELLGVGFRSYQGPAAPTVAIGPTVEFLMFNGGGGPARGSGINHACMNMDAVNVDAIKKALESIGVKPREGTTGAVAPLQHYVSLRMPNRGGAPEGTPEFYFTDPDGLLIQLQDVKYCGGNGYLGNVCPPL